MSFLDLARILVAGVVLGLVLARVVARRPRHLRRLRPRFWLAAMRKMSRKQWARLIAVSLLVAAASIMLSTLFSNLFYDYGMPMISPEEYPFTGIEQDYPLVTLAIVNVLPIFEEWIFRGIIIDEMIRWRRSKLLAVTVSALIFAFFHLSNPGTYAAFALSLIPASLLLGACYLYTGLGGAILAHDSYNTFLLLIGITMR